MSILGLQFSETVYIAEKDLYFDEGHKKSSLKILKSLFILLDH